MKVSIARSRTKLRDILPGELFAPAEFPEEVNIRINRTEGISSVRLSDGTLYSYEENDPVIPLKVLSCELVYDK